MGKRWLLVHTAWYENWGKYDCLYTLLVTANGERWLLVHTACYGKWGKEDCLSLGFDISRGLGRFPNNPKDMGTSEPLPFTQRLYVTCCITHREKLHSFGLENRRKECEPSPNTNTHAGTHTHCLNHLTKNRHLVFVSIATRLVTVMFGLSVCKWATLK